MWSQRLCPLCNRRQFSVNYTFYSIQSTTLNTLFEYNVRIRTSLRGGYKYFLELHNNRCVQYFTDCFSAYMPTLPDKTELWAFQWFHSGFFPFFLKIPIFFDFHSLVSGASLHVFHHWQRLFGLHDHNSELWWSVLHVLSLSGDWAGGWKRESLQILDFQGLASLRPVWCLGWWLLAKFLRICKL